AVVARMQLDAAGAVATIEPGGKLTVRGTSAATGPVTGLCTPSVETDARPQISHLPLAAGPSITPSLAARHPGAARQGGTGGSPGTGGTSGSGGKPPPGSGGSSGSNGWAGNDDGGAHGNLSTDGWLTNGGRSPDVGGCGCLVARHAGGDGARTAMLSI